MQTILKLNRVFNHFRHYSTLWMRGHNGNGSNNCYTIFHPCHELRSNALPVISTRFVSFISEMTTEKLWNSVTGVSNAGRKRGRAKGRMRRPRNQYKGKVIGTGFSETKWPGLNAPIVEGNQIVRLDLTRTVTEEMMSKAKQPETDTKPESSKKLFGRSTVPALQRGWSGSKYPGMSAGPPDPIGDYVFEGFDSRILEFKMVSNMTGNLGRKMRFSALVITGNHNGLAGFAFSKSTNGQSAIRKAKNRAAQKLQYFERFENHTVFHNFHTKNNKTAIFVRKQNKGYGLVCHRALKTICEIIGIENLYAKVEGSTGNILALTRAFLTGLGNQETHEKLADRMNLHVVELRSDMDYMPTVIASPTSGYVREEVSIDEDLDFERLYYDGRVPLEKKTRTPFYENFPSYKRKLDRVYKRRNQPRAKLERIVFGVEPSKVRWKKGGVVV